MLISFDVILPVVCTEVMELVEINSVVIPLLLSESVENASLEVVVCIPVCSVVVISKIVKNYLFFTLR